MYPPPPPTSLAQPHLSIARLRVLIGLVSLHSWWDLRVSAVCVLVAEIIEFPLQLHLLQRKYPAHNSPAELSRLWLTSLRVTQSYMYQRNLPVI